MARENGIRFKVDPARPWLRWAKSGPQTVAIVVCRDLPIEQPFYRWLLFAPVKGKKWPAFIQRLYNEGNDELLNLAKRLRPKEYEVIMINVDELMEQARREISPQEDARLKREAAEAATKIANNLKGRHPLQVAQYLVDMTDEQVIKVLDNFEEVRLAMMIYDYLDPKGLERVKKLAESSKRRKWLELRFKIQDGSLLKDFIEDDEPTSGQEDNTD